MERTLVLLKPDAIQRNMVGRIIGRLEDRGLKIAGLKMLHMDDEIANRHYEAHLDKPFYKGLKSFMTSSPLIAIAIEGINAVEAVRVMMGTTDPQQAGPGTIRGDFGVDIGRNLVHGSDSISAAERELSIFFDAKEIVDYKRDVDRWVIES